MKKSWLRLMLLSCFIILILVFFVYGANDFACTFIQSTSCPGGTVRLIGLENDTEGFNNAHAQNGSVAAYNYSVCCNVTDNASITITSGCPGNVTVFNLNATSNSHVEIGTESTYSYSVCLSSDWKHVSCSFPTGTCGAQACVLSMAGTEGSNITNAHVGNCSAYDQKVCCSLDNNAPTQPTLYHPSNTNTTVFYRRPNFNWSTCTDPDGDSIDYNLNITCISCPGNCPDVDIGSISTTNYTLTSPLCVDRRYNWTISACDPYDLCNTSDEFTFNITSHGELVLLVNQTTFGSLDNDEHDNTTDDNPDPFVARNIGNVLLNVTINASALFISQPLNTVYYQYMADDNESGPSDSFDLTCSQTTFANMQSTAAIIFCNMSYEDANDEGEFELGITIPPDEGSGDRSSLIKIGSIATES